MYTCSRSRFDAQHNLTFAPLQTPLGLRRARSLVACMALGATLTAGAATRPPPNNPPVISGVPPTSVAEQATYSFTPVASDPEGATLRFSVTGKPLWASFDSTTGTLSGTPSLTQAGVYASIVISASDGKNLVSLPAFNLTVTNTNQSPVISGTPSLRITAGQAYSFTPTASDPDGDVLTYTSSHKPSWATLGSKTGKLSGTPPAGTDKLFQNVKISVSDGQVSVALPTFTIDVAPAVGRNQPHGIYSLDRVVNKSFVAGVVVRAKWSDLEPVEGQYDFSEIDQAIRDAKAVGQSVTIATLPNFAPSWLIAKVSGTPDQVFADMRGMQTIVPWNETMLLALQKLVQAHAAHTVDGIALGAHPTVKQINASIGGVTSVRVLPEPPGYTYERFAAAVERSLDYWAAAFPSGKNLYTGLFYFNTGIQSPSSSDLIREWMLNRYDGVTRPRMHFFQEMLTGLSPTTISGGGKLLKGVDRRAGVMMQACGPWIEQDTGNWDCKWVEPLDTPQMGAELAMGEYRTLYFEFYPEDLESAAYSSQFTSIKSMIDTSLASEAAFAGQ